MQLRNEDGTDKVQQWDFLGIGIPIEVLINPELSTTEKILFGYVNNLSKSDDGCWASNRYLGEMIGVKPQTITNGVRKLLEYKYITIEYEQISMSTHEQIRKIHIDNTYFDRYKPLVELFNNNNRIHRNIKKYKGDIKKIIGGTYKTNSKVYNKKYKENLDLKDENISLRSKVKQVSPRNNISKKPAIKRRLRQTRDDVSILRNWNSYGKPFTVHRQDSKTGLSAIEEARKKLKKYPMKDIKFAIRQYHMLLTSSDTSIRKGPPGHLVGLYEFLHGFTSDTKARMQKQNVDLPIKSWLNECLPEKDPIGKWQSKKNQIPDTYPKITNAFKRNWLRVVLAGARKKDWNAYEERSFKIASRKFYEFIKDNKKILLLSPQEIQNPERAVRLIFEALESSNNGHMAKVTPGWLASDIMYGQTLPAFLNDQAMVRDGMEF